MLYRTESFSGSGERDFVKVLCFEIYTLGNSDSLDYIINHYNISEELRNQMVTMIEDLENDVLLEDTSEKEVLQFCKEILKELNTLLGKNLKYALWLANLDVVIDYYSCNQSTEDIYSYEESDIILSDLKADGKLFAYEELPEGILYS